MNEVASIIFTFPLRFIRRASRSSESEYVMGRLRGLKPFLSTTVAKLESVTNSVETLGLKNFLLSA